ncbi:transcription factor, contains a PHD finger motif [Recurvomyces mirabilis]|uniref:Transcription factor, contains a PHD finger motif n=1 Tax=Recurvomyces mirabilis TaxID=574656 RepID=A0AAE0WXX7_9PEZI|nr:transcription factor, contains a PHD finger motif [Recurvomyces mirabilis]KAK5162198.1 transcription factor, contains a PHD finger motif [Recurvomyces mirabilis]
MADSTPLALSHLPSEDHAPSVPSPLNPSTARAPAPTPVQREQREKKESLKKRESNNNNNNNVNGTSSSSNLGKRKANSNNAYSSPQRFNVPPPRSQDFEAPKEDIMISHEPVPFDMPDGERQLYKPIDLAENKRWYRYGRAIADPLFPHKQFYRSTSPPPHYARLSFEDADKWMHFTTNALITTNEKGWRMVRSNVCAREGTLYYEIKVHRGVPASGPEADAPGPQPHLRFGFARREAPLDAPVGFDGYSYGLTDIRFDTIHRSRPGKFFHPKKAKGKGSKTLATAGPTPVVLAPEDQHVKEGDVIGVELQLPSLTLHQKIVSGVYNPAVDIGDGFDHPAWSSDPSGAEAVADVIRDRIPVAYKGNSYFEILDLVSTKTMEVYSDRQTNLSNLTNNLTNQATTSKDVIKTAPNPNHEDASLRTLPHSAIRVYKNGKLLGTAFENLLSFLPPASTPSKTMGAREGFDDGMIGYFPAISCFWGGIAEVNFGDSKEGFWCPPAHLAAPTNPAGSKEVQMGGCGGGESGEIKKGWQPGRRARGAGERYREQVAEDVVFDLVDEVDFFVLDGGEVPASDGNGNGNGNGHERGKGRLKEED